jgi:hypothetical protein
MTIFILILMLCSAVIAPGALVWGWIRWFKSPQVRNWAAYLSLLGFLLATSSGLLAVGTICCGPWTYYDPRLLRMFRWGSLLSLAGILFVLIGISRHNTLRWFAPVSAVGTLLFWLLAAAAE